MATGIKDSAEIHLARRVLEKYKISPPVDVAGLLRKYVELKYEPIPIAGVDGVSLDLKVLGKRPSVIINSSNPPARQRFTEAHELGHVLIPWHMGSIIDDLDSTAADVQDSYWRQEQEANNFAAELLMPSQWVIDLLSSEKNYAACHRKVCEGCKVSPLAAANKLTPYLPSNLIYVCESSSKVEFSGRTEGTLARAPNWGAAFNQAAYEYAEDYFYEKVGNKTLHWWVLPSKISASTTDQRDWRTILNSMVESIGIEVDKQVSFKSSLNGVIANANSAVKRTSTYDHDTLVAACIQRIHGRDDLRAIVNHEDFNAFLTKKAMDLLEK